MTTDQRRAILLTLMGRLREQGSWCGETHVQKAAYFLQEMMDVPLDLNVILYLHGPYSADISAELSTLRADLLLDVVPRDPRYGPSLTPTHSAGQLTNQFPKTITKYAPAISFIAGKFGHMNVKELERLSTAHWIMRRDPSLLDDEIVAELVRIKPHIPPDAARQAIRDVRQIEAEVET